MIYVLSMIIIGLLGILVGMIIESVFQRMNVVTDQEQQPDQEKQQEDHNYFENF